MRSTNIVFSLLCCASFFITMAGSNRFLIENCDWEKHYHLRGPNEKVRLSMPPEGNHNLAMNLTCVTKISVLDPYKMVIKINKFELKEAITCDDVAERLTIQHEDDKKVTWCGNTYPEVFFLDSPLTVIYNSGIFGVGTGFNLEIRPSAVFQGTVTDLPVLTAGPTPKLIYSPHYPGYKRSIQMSFFVKANDGMRIHIKSRNMELERSFLNCFDYVVVEKEKLCGRKLVDIVTQNSTTWVIFSSDTSVEFKGFVLEYTAVKPITYRIQSATPNPLELTVSPSSPQVLSLQVDYSSPNRFNFTARVVPTDNKTKLLVDIPLNQITSRNCDKLEIWAGYNGTTHFKDCKAPFHTVHMPGGFFEIFFIFKSNNVFVDNKFEVVFMAVLKDTLPSSVTAGNTKSYIWIDAETVRTVLAGIQVIMSMEDGKSIYFEAASKDMLFTESSMESAKNPSDQHSLSLADHVNIYNGPNSTYYDLTYDCNNAILSSTRINTIGTNEATVKLSKLWIGFYTLGYWLVFGASSNVELPPALPLTPTLHNVRSGTYCRWSISNPDASWLKFKALLVGLEDGNGINVTTVSGNQSRPLAYISNDEGSGKWLFTKATSLEVVVHSLKNYTLLAEAHFQYQFVRNGVDLSCPLKILTAETWAKNASVINYPNYYLRNMECQWRFITVNSQPARIVLEFDSVPCYDGDSSLLVEVAMGPNYMGLKQNLCEDPKQIVFEIDVDSDLVFRSNSDMVHPGFSFKYMYYKTDTSARRELLDLTRTDEGYFNKTIYKDSRIIEYNYVVTASALSKLIFKIEEVTILPIPWDQFEDCKLQRTRFEFLEHTSQGERLHSRRCLMEGIKDPVVIRNSSQVTIKLIRALNTYVQFKISVRDTTKSDVCSNTVAIGSEDYYLYSPDYPRMSPYWECHWLITQKVDGDYRLRLEVLESRFESCLSDYLDIYDGPTGYGEKLKRVFCRGTYTVTSKQPQVYLYLKGSALFAIKIKRIGGAPSSYSESNSFGSESAVIIGSVMGAITFLLLIVGLVIILVKKRRNQNQSQHTRRRAASAEVSRWPNREDSSIFIVNPVIVNQTNAPPPPYPGLMAVSSQNDLPAYPGAEYAVIGAPVARGPPPSYNQTSTDNLVAEHPPPYEQALGFVNSSYRECEGTENNQQIYDSTQTPVGENSDGYSIAGQDDSPYSLATETNVDNEVFSLSTTEDLSSQQQPRVRFGSRAPETEWASHEYDLSDRDCRDEPPEYDEIGFGSSLTEYDVPPSSSYAHHQRQARGSSSSQTRRGHLGPL